jgi:hypothetical protein
MEEQTIDDFLARVKTSLRDEFRVYLLTGKSRPALRRYIKKDPAAQHVVQLYQQSVFAHSLTSLADAVGQMADGSKPQNTIVTEDILKQIVPDYRAEFVKFCNGEDVGEEFKKYLDTDDKAQALLVMAFQRSMDCFAPIQKVIADERTRREIEVRSALDKIVNEKEWKYWMPVYGFYVRMKNGLPLSERWNTKRENMNALYHSAFSFAIPLTALVETYHRLYVH